MNQINGRSTQQSEHNQVTQASFERPAAQSQKVRHEAGEQSHTPAVPQNQTDTNTTKKHEHDTATRAAVLALWQFRKRFGDARITRARIKAITGVPERTQLRIAQDGEVLQLGERHAKKPEIYGPNPRGRPRKDGTRRTCNLARMENQPIGVQDQRPQSSLPGTQQPSDVAAQVEKRVTNLDPSLSEVHTTLPALPWTVR